MLRLSLHRRRQLLPWVFLGPGLLWLIVFFAIPLINQLNVSLQSGDAENGYSFTWEFSTYTNAISDYSTQFFRSIGYSAAATVLCLIIAFPLAYFTAFKAGRFKNFILLLIILPFMALPLYVSLEKIDRRLIEAATDLYASRTTAFRKVTLPLAMPGIFAGSLLTFIPAVGDFINAQFLGTSRQYMIGNVIQSKFLVTTDYPVA